MVQKNDDLSKQGCDESSAERTYQLDEDQLRLKIELLAHFQNAPADNSHELGCCDPDTREWTLLHETSEEENSNYSGIEKIRRLTSNLALAAKGWLKKSVY